MRSTVVRCDAYYDDRHWGWRLLIADYEPVVLALFYTVHLMQRELVGRGIPVASLLWEAEEVTW